MDDAVPLLKIFSDPTAMRYFGVIFNRHRMDEWVRSNLEHDEKNGFSLLTVVLKQNGEVIGDCGLETDTIEGHLIVGIGFDFNPSYWGRGYASEAAAAVLEYGFSKFMFEHISCWIDPENQPSRRVAERIGMSVDQHVIRAGKQYVIYSIGKDDWDHVARIHRE